MRVRSGGATFWVSQYLLGLARTMECMRRIQVNRELPDASRLTLSLCRARSQLHGGDYCTVCGTAIWIAYTQKI